MTSTTSTTGVTTTQGNGFDSHLTCVAGGTPVSPQPGCTTQTRYTVVTSGGITYHEAVNTLFDTTSVTHLMDGSSPSPGIITTSSMSSVQSSSASSTLTPLSPVPAQAPNPASSTAPVAAPDSSSTLPSPQRESTSTFPSSTPSSLPSSASTTTTSSTQAAGPSPSTSSISLPHPSSGQAQAPSAPPNTTPRASPLILTPNTAGQYSFSSTVLVPGGPPVTVGGTTYSFASSSDAIVVNGQTTSLPQDTPASNVVIAGQTITAATSGHYVVGGQTLSAGGSQVTADGTTYSLALASNAVVVNGQTSFFSTTAAPSLTLAGQIVTADPAGRYVVAGQTLVAGGTAVVISESTYSLVAGGTALVVNSQTIALTSTAHGLPTLTLGVQTLPTDSAGNYIIGTQTLKPGGLAIIVLGATYSLAASGSSAVRISGGTTTTEGLGAAIMSGLGQGGNATASTTGPAMYTGLAAKAYGVRRNVVMIVGAVIPMLGL